jgi:hypothetical protein
MTEEQRNLFIYQSSTIMNLDHWTHGRKNFAVMTMETRAMCGEKDWKIRMTFSAPRNYHHHLGGQADTWFTFLKFCQAAHPGSPCRVPFDTAMFWRSCPRLEDLKRVPHSCRQVTSHDVDVVSDFQKHMLHSRLHHPLSPQNHKSVMNNSHF